MNTLSIRKTTAEDIPKIMALVEELNISDLPFNEQVDVKWGETDEGKKYYTEKIDATKGICFIAEIENEPLGFIMGEIEDNSYRTIKVVFVVNLYVKEDFRNQGIGKKLVDVFIDWGKKIGAQKVSVTAYTPNKKAIQFYEREGFQPFNIKLERSLIEK